MSNGKEKLTAAVEILRKKAKTDFSGYYALLLQIVTTGACAKCTHLEGKPDTNALFGCGCDHYGTNPQHLAESNLHTGVLPGQISCRKQKTE